MRIQLGSCGINVQVTDLGRRRPRYLCQLKYFLLVTPEKKKNLNFQPLSYILNF